MGEWQKSLLNSCEPSPQRGRKLAAPVLEGEETREKRGLSALAFRVITLASTASRVSSCPCLHLVSSLIHLPLAALLLLLVAP